MIPNDILDRINDETDIVSLVSQYVQLENVGKNYRGLCPFHDDSSPSFYVSPEKNIAMCMSCRSGGRPINFLRLIKNIPLIDAATELGKLIGIDVLPNRVEKVDPNIKYYQIMKLAMDFYELNLSNSESGLKVLKYLENRGLKEETIKEFNLGYAPNESDILYQYLKSSDISVSDMIELGLVNQAKDGNYYDFFRNRLIFPITNRYGKVVAFSARTLEKKDKVKYINSPESKIFKKSEVLYNLNEANLEIRKHNKVIVFEGFFDTISASQAGIKHSVATMGTSLTDEHVRLIRQATNNVVLAFDGDNAGINAVMKLIPVLENKINTEVLALPSGSDPDDYIKNNGTEKFLKLVNEETLDHYMFRYNYYFNNTDFTNANDLKVFEDNVKKMLTRATPAIISLYSEKLAKALNVNVNTIEIKRERVPLDPYMFEPVPAEKRIVLDNKYVVAEQRLFILMMRSDVWSDRITDNLGVNDFGNIILSQLRMKIATYYMYSRELNLQEFKDMLNEEELNYFETKIQKDYYWIDQIRLEDNEINEYISILKEAPLVRRQEYLRKLMVEKHANKEDFDKIYEEYILNAARLIKSKEDV